MDINVFLLPEMVTGNPPPELQLFAGLLGLGVSPELLAQVPADDPARMLYEWLAVPGAFTPTVIVGVRPVNEFLVDPDIAIAHELGHAYGLPHVTEAGNLLHPGEIACQQSLSSAQLERIQATTAALASEVDLESLSLTERAGDFVSAVRSLLFRTGR
jgi:hypothetical protein